MNNRINLKMIKRKNLTFQQKAELVAKLKTEKIKNQRMLATKYEISVGLVNKLINSDENAFNIVNMKRKRDVFLTKTKDIEPILYEWFQYQRSRNISINGDILKRKALDISQQLKVTDFKASNGWLDSFLTRNLIDSKKNCGEAATVSTTLITNFKACYYEKLKEYDEKDIFNCDETGLFYKQASTNTYICSTEDKANGKFSKERLTILLCTSMVGEKMKPLLIGKSANPHCFKGIKKQNLPVYYYNNCKSWMTLDIFNDWLTKLNAEMRSKQRKILLLLDNAPVHPKDIMLSNVELFYFPPNTSSLIQPLDQGIIKSIKDRYKQCVMDFVSFQVDCKQNLKQEDLLKDVNIYRAIMWISKSWYNVSIDCIKNGFKKSYQNAMITKVDGIEAEIENEAKKSFPAYKILDTDYDLNSIMITYVSENITSEENSENTDGIIEEPIMTSLDAFNCIKRLERYFIQNVNEEINRIWELENIILK